MWITFSADIALSVTLVGGLSIFGAVIGSKLFL
jgi:hypothetical protein